jgi:imidazolonepropionase-like amidohydrolase
VFVVTTLGGALRALGTSVGDARMREAMLDVYRDNLQLLIQHGVRIAIGSDETRGSVVTEAEQLHASGLLSNRDLLNALTFTGRTLVFPAKDAVGPVEGAAADFIALDSNPLEGFGAIRRVALRVKAGRTLTID